MLKLKKWWKLVKVAVKNNRTLSETIYKVNKRIYKKELREKERWVLKVKDKNLQQLHFQCLSLNSNFQIKMFMSLFSKLNWHKVKIIFKSTEWKTDFKKLLFEIKFEVESNPKITWVTNKLFSNEKYFTKSEKINHKFRVRSFVIQFDIGIF